MLAMCPIGLGISYLLYLNTVNPGYNGVIAVNKMSSQKQRGGAKSEFSLKKCLEFKRFFVQ